MYDIVHITAEGNRSHRAVIASGFAYSSDARLAVANWVKQHFPRAEYDPETAPWRGVDERGSMHAFFIEPQRPESCCAVAYLAGAGARAFMGSGPNAGGGTRRFDAAS